MNDIITTSELFALTIRNIKKIIITSLVAALLFAGVQIYSLLTRSPDALISEQEIYTQTVRNLGKIITREEANIATEEAYIEASAYMHLNPYDLHVSTISFSVTDLDESAFQQVFRDETTPIEYLTGKIVTHYLTLWGTFDLPSQLDLPEYEDMMDKYVRELVSAYSSGNGILTIQAIGATAQQADQLASSAYNLLTSQKDIVSEGSYLHDVSLLSATTKNIINEEMQKTQQAHRDSVDTSRDTIISARLQLQKLSPPSSDLVSVIKMVIIGGIIGFAVSFLWICLAGILRTPLLSSQQLERSLSILPLGAIPSRFNFITRIAYNIAKEQTWESQEQALQYIAQRVSSLGGKTVLLTSSLPLPLENPSVNALIKLLERQQLHVSFASDFTHNPNALASLAHCDEVCLIESIGLSDMTSIGKMTTDIKRSNRAIAGFVII